MPRRQKLKLIPVRKYFNSERFWKDHANWRNESLIWTRESKKTRWKLQKVYFQKLNKRQNHFFVIHYLLNPVGMCGLTKIDPKNGTAEFSLLVGSRYRGQGIGTKALVHLLRYGFNTLGLKLIFGETFSYKSTHGTNPGLEHMRKSDLRMKVLYEQDTSSLEFQSMHSSIPLPLTNFVNFGHVQLRT